MRKTTEGDIINECLQSSLRKRAAEAIRRINLERCDIAALGNGAILHCKIDDVRYWHDLILDQKKELEKYES